MHIEAKPTIFNGKKYRSRLEARWAVFISLHPLITEAYYEPFRLKDTLNGQTYTPDFKIQVSDLVFYLEIKPSNVTEEAIADILSWAPALDYNLMVLAGSFYEEDIVPHAHPEANEEDLNYLVTLINKEYKSFQRAKTWRFDLA